MCLRTRLGWVLDEGLIFMSVSTTPARVQRHMRAGLGRRGGRPAKDFPRGSLARYDLLSNIVGACDEGAHSMSVSSLAFIALQPEATGTSVP